jgi:hypothetical protein
MGVYMIHPEQSIPPRTKCDTTQHLTCHFKALGAMRGMDHAGTSEASPTHKRTEPQTSSHTVFHIRSLALMRSNTETQEKTLSNACMHTSKHQ